jgi:hypothetical protein
MIKTVFFIFSKVRVTSLVIHESRDSTSLGLIPTVRYILVRGGTEEKEHLAENLKYCTEIPEIDPYPYGERRDG